MGKNLADLYKRLSDEELALSAKTDKAAVTELIARYICSIEYLANKYCPAAADDLMQEGFMGLLKAVKTYDPQKNVKFVTYAAVCIKNKMLSAVKKNSMIADIPEEELEERFFYDSEEIPENIIIQNERMSEIYDKISSTLSEQEWQVFQLFLTGMSYNQMALNLGVSVKAVDNAMQRVRRKLKSLLR